MRRSRLNEPLGAAVEARALEDEAAVLAELDRPRDAVAVLVDLELDLQAAVVALDLELGGARVAAGAGDADAVAALGRSGLSGCRAERSGDGEGGGDGLGGAADHDDSLVSVDKTSLSADRLGGW